MEEKQHDGPPPSYTEQPHLDSGVYMGPQQPVGAPMVQPQGAGQGGPQFQQQMPHPGVVYQQPGGQQPLQAQNVQPQYMQAPTTTVIVNQPVPGAPGAAPRMWSTGICSFCDDMGICCCGLFFGMCLACKVASDMGESYCVPVLVPAADITLRTKWRTQENIQGSILDDCLTVWCCGPCAMCQLAREVKAKRNGTLNPRPH